MGGMRFRRTAFDTEQVLSEVGPLQWRLDTRPGPDVSQRQISGAKGGTSGRLRNGSALLDGKAQIQRLTGCKGARAIRKAQHDI